MRWSSRSSLLGYGGFRIHEVAHRSWRRRRGSYERDEQMGDITTCAHITTWGHLGSETKPAKQPSVLESAVSKPAGRPVRGIRIANKKQCVSDTKVWFGSASTGRPARQSFFSLPHFFDGLSLSIITTTPRLVTSTPKRIQSAIWSTSSMPSIHSKPPSSYLPPLKLHTFRFSRKPCSDHSRSNG